MNKKLLIVLAVILAIVVVVGISAVGSYNSLVGAEENVLSSKSQIDNQLQRRNDLIPNLVETVKGYAAHESQVFADVSDARARMMAAGTTGEQAAADNELRSSLSRLLAVSEAYPELKANQNFIQLQDELAGTENRIAVARQDYNTAAKDYNSTIRKFPKVIFAKIMGFDTFEYFEAQDGAEDVPDVNF